MGVYIPNVKFPQNCDECDLLYDCCACGVTHKRMDFETMDRVRNPHCPLVPVPPHGRLIDADALISNFEFTMKHCTIKGHTAQRYREMIVELSVAPTIIPANPAEEARE